MCRSGVVRARPALAGGRFRFAFSSHWEVLMNHLTRWALAAALVLPFAACSSGPPPVTTTAPTPPPPSLSQADRDFINQAAMGGEAEVQLGQLAAQKAAQPQVRDFGQQMVSDHTQLNQQLMQVAQAKGVTPPTSLDPTHAEMLARLQRLRGAAFDRAYLQGQIADHQTTLALFQNEAANGTDPDLKALAAQAVPTIQHHLEEARALVGGRRLPPVRR